MHTAKDTPKLVMIEQLNAEMIGPMTLSAVLKAAGYDCELILASQERDLLNAVRRAKPSVLGFSTRTGQHAWCLAQARLLKTALGLPVLFGGPHATACPEVIRRPEVDYVLVGEAERSLVELFEALDGRRDLSAVTNLLYKNASGEILRTAIAAPCENLDELPLADREFAYKYKVLRDYPSKTFVGSRGCPLRCTFCHNNYKWRLHKGYSRIRMMSPERIVHEVAEVKRRYPLKYVSYDNNDHFFHNWDWAERILELHAQRIGLPYFVETRPDGVTRQSVRKLAETGCAGVAFSVETADERLRNRVLQKHIDLDQAKEAAALLHEAHIPLKLYLMVGIPGETLDDSFRTLDLAAELRPMFASCQIAMPYPGTALKEQAIEMGVFPPDYDLEQFPYGYNVRSLLSLPEIDRMANLQRFFALAARYPALLPGAKRLCKLPPNRLFTMLGIGSYVYFGARYVHLGPKDFAELLASHLRYGYELLFSK